MNDVDFSVMLIRSALHWLDRGNVRMAQNNLRRASERLVAHAGALPSDYGLPDIIRDRWPNINMGHDG